MVDRLGALRDRASVRWMGLMSGTSCDGIDVAVLDLEEVEGDLPRASFVHGDCYPFDAADSRRLIDALSRDPSAERVATWDRWFGDQFASAATRSIQAGGPVNAIVVSGHTFAHLPAEGATLQVGNPSVVVAATGVPVVAGLRASDVACGGEGAPLVPVGDRVLFGRPDRAVAVVNLGGISNVTWLRDRRACPCAADCGPSNLILDHLVHAGTGGRESIDRDGERAARGTVQPDLVRRWMEHPFFDSDRRSTGREEFGEPWVNEHRDELESLAIDDRLATVADWIAESVAHEIRLLSGPTAAALLVGGGGALNRGVMAALRRRFTDVEVLDRERHGVSESLREAAAFAILGHELLTDAQDLSRAPRVAANRCRWEAGSESDREDDRAEA